MRDEADLTGGHHRLLTRELGPFHSNTHTLAGLKSVTRRPPRERRAMPPMRSMTGTIRASCSDAVCCGWISRPRVSGAQGLEEHLCCSTARRIPECRSARQFISASCLSYFLSPRHAHTHTQTHTHPSHLPVTFSPLNVGRAYRQSVNHTNNARADKAEGK